VDDHTLLRQGIRALLATHPQYEIVAEASNGKEGYDCALAHNPDIVLMEMSLPGMHGLALAGALKQRLPATRIVMLTTRQTDELLREALRTGVDGYLFKDASFEELLLALRSVAVGKRYLSPSVSVHLVDGFLHPERSRAKGAPLGSLTQRERSVLQFIAEGRSNRSTGELLKVSTKTVEKHRANLMRKLGLRNAAELIMAATELGLIERPDGVSRLVEPARPG